MIRRSRDPSLLGGVVVALALSLSGAALLAALTPILGAGQAFRAVVALLSLSYVLYVLGASAQRTGRISSVVLCSAAAAIAWFAEPPITVYVMLHIGLIWLFRSLYHHASALSTLADLGLTVLAAAFGAWALSRSGSAWLALWCFFLVQAFFVVLPAGASDGTCESAAEDGAAFERAHRAAQAALRRLVRAH